MLDAYRAHLRVGYDNELSVLSRAYGVGEEVGLSLQVLNLFTGRLTTRKPSTLRMYQPKPKKITIQKKGPFRPPVLLVNENSFYHLIIKIIFSKK